MYYRIFFFFKFVFIYFITYKKNFETKPPQRPSTIPHLGCQGPPGLEIWYINIIDYRIWFVYLKEKHTHTVSHNGITKAHL